MPRAPLRPCLQPACPGFAEPGRRYCPTHAHLEYEKRRGTAVQRGYDWAWQRLSSAYRVAIGNRCEIVVTGQRCTKPADEIHHVWPVTMRPLLRLVWANLRGLCISHHRYAERDTEHDGRPPAWVITRIWEQRHHRRSEGGGPPITRSEQTL
jgi:hypothetical protein